MKVDGGIVSNSGINLGSAKIVANVGPVITLSDGTALTTQGLRTLNSTRAPYNSYKIDVGNGFTAYEITEGSKINYTWTNTENRTVASLTYDRNLSKIVAATIGVLMGDINCNSVNGALNNAVSKLTQAGAKLTDKGTYGGIPRVKDIVCYNLVSNQANQEMINGLRADMPAGFNIEMVEVEEPSTGNYSEENSQYKKMSEIIEAKGGKPTLANSFLFSSAEELQTVLPEITKNAPDWMTFTAGKPYGISLGFEENRRLQIGTSVKNINVKITTDSFCRDNKTF